MRNRKADAAWYVILAADFVILVALLIAFILIGLGFSADAQAADNTQGLRGGVIMGSEHWSDADYNEEQEGVYFCYWRICAGRYENSYSNSFGNGTMHSNFALYEHHLGTAGIVDFTALAGVVDGYDGNLGNDNNIQPYGGISARIGIVKIWQFGRATAYGVEFWEGIFHE